MRPAAVIPARFGSQRLPGKPLADLCGKPVIQHVVERAREADIFSRILVATDSPEILRCVEGFGGEAVMTSQHHRCGTERIAEAAAHIEEDCIINIQGDEPFLAPEMLRLLWSSFRNETVAVMGTLCHPLTDPEEIVNPNAVKVVTDSEGYALYFSRSAIPWPDFPAGTEKIDEAVTSWYKHVGVYAYRRDFLLLYPTLQVAHIEKVERLEQLRVLALGYRIRVYQTPYKTQGIDTPEDLDKARKLLGG